MELIGAAFGHHGDLSAGIAAVLGLILSGENLELGDGIGADGDVLAAIGAGVDIADTVDGELVHGAAVPVHIDAAESAGTADRNVRGTHHAGDELRHIERIASVDLEVVDLLADDGLGALHAFGLQHGLAGGNFDRLQ